MYSNRSKPSVNGSLFPQTLFSKARVSFFITDWKSEDTCGSFLSIQLKKSKSKDTYQGFQVKRRAVTTTKNPPKWLQSVSSRRTHLIEVSRRLRKLTNLKRSRTVLVFCLSNFLSSFVHFSSTFENPKERKRNPLHKTGARQFP